MFVRDDGNAKGEEPKVGKVAESPQRTLRALHPLEARFCEDQSEAEVFSAHEIAKV